MKKTLTSFKKFLEDMDPSFEKNMHSSMGTSNKEPEKEDYFSALGDEQGIEWEDLSTALENQPWVSSHFDLGGTKHKLSAWQIVKGSLSPEGADIQLKPQRGDRSYLKGNRLNKSDYRDNKKYHLNRQQLINFLTTGWTPAVQAAQAGGMGDMGAAPPMGI